MARHVSLTTNHSRRLATERVVFQARVAEAQRQAEAEAQRKLHALVSRNNERRGVNAA